MKSRKCGSKTILPRKTSNTNFTVSFFLSFFFVEAVLWIRNPPIFGTTKKDLHHNVKWEYECLSQTYYSTISFALAQSRFGIGYNQYHIRWTWIYPIGETQSVNDLALWFVSFFVSCTYFVPILLVLEFFWELTTIAVGVFVSATGYLTTYKFYQ